jgi:hypothetical protein
MRTRGRLSNRAAAATAIAVAVGAFATFPLPLHAAPKASRRACVPAPLYQGSPPAWTAPAWANSSPGLTATYALTSGHLAVAIFFANPLRAGHPTNPTNKVLWIVRLPRNGKPLNILARFGADPTQTVRIRRPADSSPGEIYPSYVDLPKPGCWSLTLSWGTHTTHLNVQVHPLADQ